LERLMEDRVEPPMPAGWRAYVGDDDVFLSAEELRRIDPVIVRVAGGTHHPEVLIRTGVAAMA